MKPTSRKILSCSFILLLPLFLGALFIWTLMWRAVGLREGESCIRSFQPVQKGMYWNNGEWHHYVDFYVDVPTPLDYRWRITEAPMPSSILRGYSESHTLRVTYRWPDDWVDPFPLERWEICLLHQ